MIELENLRKHYGSVEAVRGLDLVVPRGEVFCFLGPNGAGKTSTIKMMTGLIRPTSGKATIGGYDVQESPTEAKRLMGYIPDMPYLYERLTTEEFFSFTGDLYEVPSDKIATGLEEYFGMFGLMEHRDVLIKELSHGMRQRVIYAATLLHDPKVLFVDEPLVGLDPYTIRLIKDLLVTRAREGMTVFLTTHILALAEDIADRIGIIFEGKMLALGTLAELKHEYGDRKLEEIFLDITGGNVATRSTTNP
jgi:ABC-2 type transport system ATP-binding protein